MKTMAGALLAGGALLVSACGGGSSGVANTQSTAKTSGNLMISTTKGADGTYLTDSSGRALYLWVADKNGKSVCSGACAQAWPPLTSKSTPSALGDVKAGDLGTVARTGGAKQVTYKGHPLYYFAGDTAPGKITGQGSPEFGAKWWLVAPSGAAITTPVGGGTSSSGATGAY